MESKKINQLATELAPALSDLTIIGDPTTGISKKITLSQMASLFTGTVEEYASVSAFPLVGVADTIYIALDTNVLYRWDTTLTSYVELSPNIINSLVFNDANGFDGTISLVGSVATLTITTALTQGSVGFIGASGALVQDNANFFWDDTNNRLGIGTNAPTTAIDVFGSGIIGRLNGTSTNNSFLGFASAETNKWSIGNVQSDHRFRIYSEANTAELISVLQTGEFGIGIANPTTKLHIDGGASALIANLDANVSVAKSISFRSDNSNRINLEVSGTESGSNAGADLFVRTYTDAGALLDTPLTITRSTGAATFSNSLSALGVLSTKSDLQLIASNSTNKWNLYTYTDNSLRINYNGAGNDELIIDSNGYSSFGSNVAIGKTAGSTYIFDALKDDSTTNTVIGVAQFGRATTGTAGNGIGGNIQLNAEDTAGNQRTAAYIGWSLANASSASPEGYMYLGSRNSPDAIRIADSGAVSLNSTISATTSITGATIKLTGFTNYGTINDANDVRRIWFENTGSYRTIFDLPVSGTGFSFRKNDGTSLAELTNAGAFTTSYIILKRASGAGAIYFKDTSGNDKFEIGHISNALYFYNYSTGADSLRITSGGAATELIKITNNLASGDPVNIQNLFTAQAPNNQGSQFLYCGDSSALRLKIVGNGGIHNYQANNVNLSDRNTKKEIAPLDSYWNKFKDIEIVKFKYIDQTHDDFNIGVIAQQVEEVAPEFVDTSMWNLEGKEVERKAIYTSDLHHATIKVLQEAMAKIEILEEKIKQLESK